VSLPFALPPQSPGKPIPKWMGNGFQVADDFVRVLEYSSNDSGWSDDLTRFHEDVAGSDHFIDRASRQHALEQLLKYIGEGSSAVLEVGCSSGFLLREISRHLKNALVIGSDIVYQPLEQLAVCFPELPLFRFDLVKCPFPDACIDAVIMLNVLEHIDNDLLAMQQVHRILKPGGVVIIEVPAGPHLYDSYDKSLKHYRRYTLAGLRRLAQQADLRVVKQSHLGFLLYPGFYLVKRRGKQLLLRSDDVQQQATARNIRQTASNQLFEVISGLELIIGKYVSYPIGIRCLLTCAK
jgi:SAM-dependent methyltransferase